MKKFILALMVMSLCWGMVIVMTPTRTEAQTYLQRVRGRDGRIHWVRVRKPSYYRRHRNRINMAAGTAGGAVVGGLIGGRRGALIGAGTGLAGSALYTYKIRPKKRKYRKIRRY
jgi:Predicted membrane protein